MGNIPLNWSIAAVAALVAGVSAVRVATTTGETRLTAGADLLMGLGMTLMALPATASWYGAHGIWWAATFGLVALGGISLAVQRARDHGWKEGRHRVHLIIGSAGMVIMTLAMTSTSSGPVLALGSSMAGMPGMEETAATTTMSGMEGMQGMPSMPGMSMAGMDSATTSAAPSHSLWHYVVLTLGVYFALSIGASVRARVRGTDKSLAAGRNWGRWLLAVPDTLLVCLASLTLSVWDRARTGEQSCRGRRRKVGAAPDAALAAHIGMGTAMSGMLLLMAT
ncbi:DUF5134 domain-containing protein [Streptomyces sp. NPDC001544]|uniref:DUF5134 domain-containing protein n=1 Tax=Streptomyces sp. NPDC001544 TaxID=3364584 RepID=UPI00368D9E11